MLSSSHTCSAVSVIGAGLVGAVSTLLRLLIDIWQCQIHEYLGNGSTCVTLHPRVERPECPTNTVGVDRLYLRLRRATPPEMAALSAAVLVSALNLVAPARGPVAPLQLEMNVWYSPHFDFVGGSLPPPDFFSLLTHPSTAWYGDLELGADPPPPITHTHTHTTHCRQHNHHVGARCPPVERKKFARIRCHDRTCAGGGSVAPLVRVAG